MSINNSLQTVTTPACAARQLSHHTYLDSELELREKKKKHGLPVYNNRS